MVGGWCGVLCENCIVDASIKPCACHRHFLLVVGVWLCDFCSFVFCVVHAGMNDAAAFVVVVVCVGCVFVI